jgi:exoribonuclease-2
MYKIKNLVIYKNKAAIVTDIGDKITIKLNEKSDAAVRVREKDIEFLHAGPLENFDAIDTVYDKTSARELWELTSSEPDAVYSLHELSEFLDGGDCAPNAWTVHLMLEDALYFEGDLEHIKPKNAETVAAEESKRKNKSDEEALRDAFLQRLKKMELLPDDRRFLQDVEQLALGKSEKSRTMRDAGLSSEDSVAAHKLLLETGIWHNAINPHPSRYGVSMQSPKISIKQIADELPNLNNGLNDGRRDLTHLAAYAIDDEWSTDPDDALSLEFTDEGTFLYVHVADPAAAVTAGSNADIDARARGATFYAPEAVIRMLNDDALPVFALGLSGTSPALSFQMKLACGVLDTAAANSDGHYLPPANFIEKIEIFPSIVHVTRLNYREADDKIGAAGGDNALLPFFTLAERNIKRRLVAGAVQIDFPEVQIHVKIDENQPEKTEIEIKPVTSYNSRILVRECMLLAGEGAGIWALEKRIPFPFISQETENPEEELPDGYAGAYQLRRCMRPRILSTKPGLHQGLGLDIYTQVTSPLRRYTDLLAHQQIRACLAANGETDILGEDELLARLAAAERAALATSRAERASRAHWIAVHCAQNIGMETEGIVIALRGSHAVTLIPALGLETQVALPRGAAPALNSTVKLQLVASRIPESETVWNILSHEATRID